MLLGLFPNRPLAHPRSGGVQSHPAFRPSGHGRSSGSTISSMTGAWTVYSAIRRSWGPFCVFFREGALKVTRATPRLAGPGRLPVRRLGSRAGPSRGAGRLRSGWPGGPSVWV